MRPPTRPPFPDAPWPDAPRLGPAWPWPPYRYVSGHAPHPVTHPEGHRYGQPEPDAPPAGTPWAENAAYLRGIDLYHAGFYWEAHEFWEAVWKTPGLAPAPRALVQALILIAAARLKVLEGSSRGVALSLTKARARLARLNSETLWGVDVAGLKAFLERPEGRPAPRFSLG